MIKFKKAFACSKGKPCPESNGEDGCPNWTEIVMENTQTGETKVNKGCAPQLMQTLMVEVIKASNRPAAEMGEIRHSLIDGFQALAQSQQQMAHKFQQALNAQLEHQGD